MNMVHTSTGPIPLDALGLTLMHEHLVMAIPGWEGDTTVPPPGQRELVARCVDHIEELKAGGFSSLLDPLPNDVGRDLGLYAEVAARTGFNILFATGLYNEVLGGPYWKFKLLNDPLGWEYASDMFIRELTDGVGPTRAKPAVIKLGVGPDPESQYERLLVKAAARASLATGAPILTHTDGIFGDLLLDRLKGLGVPAQRIIIGHSCGSDDAAYHRRIVEGGCYIGFDRFGLSVFQSDDVRVDRLHRLLAAGYAEQVIVSHDCVFCQRGALLPEGILTTDAMHFSRNVVPQLHALGVEQATIDSLLRDNPRRYFSSESPAFAPADPILSATFM